MRCPGCGKELKTEAKSCPNCNRLLVVDVRDGLHSQSIEDHRPIRIMEGSSDDSQYAGVLKPHSTIDVKGIGSKMTSPPIVTAVRHKITTSDESESSLKLRCIKCGTVNEKSDKFCRNCGTRIA